MAIYHKLVRDRIPEIISKAGGSSTTHYATEEEYVFFLRKKLHEEVEEYLSASTAEKRSHELADILEVHQALAALDGYAPAQIEELRLKKKLERGGFTRRIILEEA